MTTMYSVAEARNQFATLIRWVEKGETAVHITRRGETVAVILSQQAYEALLARPPQKNFWAAYTEWRQKWDVDNIDIDPDAIWGDTRDKTPAPNSNPWL